MVRAIVVAVGVLLISACGRLPGAAENQPAPPPPPIAATAAAPISASDAAPTAPSTARPAAFTSRFTGTISNPPVARIRFGPGLDMPVLDLEPVGRTETFDSWLRRADEPALPDSRTSRIEAWSRDWYHLADGRGWVHAAAVDGRAPADLAAYPWQAPPSLPSSVAGYVDVEVHHQELRASCEAASLKMALAARGISVSEARVLSTIGVDRRAPVLGESGTIVSWGNPNSVFVGDPAGATADRTGYGVYAGPVARAARQLGAGVAAAGTGVAPRDVYAAVIAGRPVVAWVTVDYSRGEVLTWHAWDGTPIRWTQKEHAATVVGVTATHVLLNDPFSGRIWKPKPDFEASYATLGNMAVILA